MLQEKNLSRTVFQLGLPTALSYQIVTVGSQYGVIYEMLVLRTISEILTA